MYLLLFYFPNQHPQFHNSTIPQILKSILLGVPAYAVGPSAVSFSAALQKDAAAVPDAWGEGTRTAYARKQKSPSIYAEASAMGWRRPTFPQIDAVSSALRGLTSLFGMGRGGPPRYSHHVYHDMS